MSTLVIPGDEISIDSERPVVLGPGMYNDPVTQRIVPVNAGLLNISDSKKGQTIYVEYDSKRYSPAVGDLVVGIITGAFGDSYRVSLSSFSTPVSLSYMAFPNASKKNRPTLVIGDLVYARVCNAEKELEAEIECVDSTNGSDAGFGLLENGMVIEATLGFTRSLLFNNEFPLLRELAQHCKFEIAIGVNGKIWIKTDEVKETIACYRSISDCQGQPQEKFQEIIKNYFLQVTNTVEE
ncbi:similar to Saccharomyces cerevisiae YOL142W RRP40 Exosome non-catalytic core component [Maudiozyma barnettii]|uniref:Ribosomal RNA-processing protein 40 n=1 Tax=Maudiozyma barnettii TaxID=61262 RepID=A0A8H2ZJB0_9SACH|nr:exosome non-catalytic core subunit RRP40 [Kazachstania barnettii]CAB4256823.1 similar to Saccharomyces cerevisiae YOL142W RRP40 Exosome non-catalytic core component [Kazachstania barnettii]CAD1785477.1 similar to Saccharomyces cerevisiae YOL142W RRP40 Exosome non-catalytic core component [Kazachstania barnettii]